MYQLDEDPLKLYFRGGGGPNRFFPINKIFGAQIRQVWSHKTCEENLRRFQGQSAC